MDALKLAQNERTVASHVHVTHLNEPTIFECDNGQIGSVIQYAGIPFDTKSDAALNQFRQVLHHAIQMLGEQFCIYEHTIRRKLDVSLKGKFEDAFTREVDALYHAGFKQHQLYQNTLYITLMYKGVDAGKAGKSLLAAKQLSDAVVKGARQAYREKAIASLKKQREQFIAITNTFGPKLLGEQDLASGTSEVLSFLGSLINGLYRIPYRVPKIGFYPMANLSLYLPASRLFFGECIELLLPEQSRFAGILSIKTYPKESASVMLDKLLQLDAEFIQTNSYAIQPQGLMQKKVWRQMIKLENASDPATSQINQLSECRDHIASGSVSMGYHQNTLMILADSIEAVKKGLNQAIRFYAEAGIVAVAETIGLEPAFWSQIPGNQKYSVRPTLITSQNFVDFCPLHNYPVGFQSGNHLGSAVSIIETISKTPLFFNFHRKGSGDKNDLTPGHTTIIGGNGSGKTVFMGFMDAQMSRFGGRSFFFDRDCGMEIYVRATGGAYFKLSPCGGDVELNPFSLPDTPKNRSFLKIWMGSLVQQPTEQTLPADIQAIISECVEYAFEALAQSHRYLSNVVKILPIDFPRWHSLNRWLKAEGARSAGEYATLFDNQADGLLLEAAKIGFDLTALLDLPESVLVSVCMYLVHLVKCSLDGSRVSIYFDEGWQILNNSYWRTQLKKDLPTFRKLNAHIVLATQSPESVVNSSLSAQFLDNCATNIFFCNPNGNYEKHYQHFGLSETEFEFIQQTPTGRRLFLYKQNDFSAVCKLNLSHMKKVLAVFSANKSTLTLFTTLYRETGGDPRKWLPLFYQQVGAGNDL